MNAATIAQSRAPKTGFKRFPPSGAVSGAACRFEYIRADFECNSVADGRGGRQSTDVIRLRKKRVSPFAAVSRFSPSRK